MRKQTKVLVAAAMLVDEDSKSWFWVDAKGKLFSPSGSTVTTMKFENGATRTIKDKKESLGGTKTINNEKYVFNEDGKMLSGLVTIATEDATDLYYFGGSEDGAIRQVKSFLKIQLKRMSTNSTSVRAMTTIIQRVPL